jgi:purine nucleosidase/ribosylpyrimidine nucleosidase
MGGADRHGNSTPSAEFNIWADPEAADIVLTAGFETLTLVPLDATHQALVMRDDVARFIGRRIDAYSAGGRVEAKDARRCTTRSAQPFSSTAT